MWAHRCPPARLRWSKDPSEPAAGDKLRLDWSLAHFLDPCALGKHGSAKAQQDEQGGFSRAHLQPVGRYVSSERLVPK